jgi:hypothetical protein
LLKQLLELGKLYLLVLLVLLGRLGRHQLEHQESLEYQEHRVLVGLLAFQELQALLELLDQVEHLLEQWFIPTRIHRSQTQTQETMFITDTPLTIQIGTDTKFVVLTITTPHTTTLALIMEHHTPLVTAKLVQSMFPQIITEAPTTLLLIIQTHIAITVVITTRLIMTDLTAVFITGMDIGGMPITN